MCGRSGIARSHSFRVSTFLFLLLLLLLLLLLDYDGESEAALSTFAYISR